ncbi:MAG: hypothetical protein P8X96_25050 [Desulfobacteraceae bacterium]
MVVKNHPHHANKDNIINQASLPSIDILTLWLGDECFLHMHPEKREERNLMRIFNYVLLLLFAATTIVQAEGVFISAPNRKDMVYDDIREIIYISDGPEVLRYSTSTDAFLPSFTLGGNLNGMSLSPDGNVLAVADTVAGATTNHVYLVDLQSGLSEIVEFPLDLSEGGTWTVTYGDDGLLLITSMYNGSGWVPMRRYDRAADTYDILPDVRQNTMLSASGDATKILYAEDNSSSGPVGSYDVASRSFSPGTTIGWFTFEVASNRNGTHISVPTYGGTFLFDNAWNSLGVLGTYAGPQPIGVVYHPVEDLAYYPWSGSQLVYIYDTNTNTSVGSFDFENAFVHTGNSAFVAGRSKISRDGSLLMVTVDGGVRYLRMYAALATNDANLSVDKNGIAPITLEGTVGNGGSISFEIVMPPTEGDLIGTMPNLEYVPYHDVVGNDQFTYAAVYGRARAVANVNVTINDVLGASGTGINSLDDTRKRIGWC